MSPLLAIAEAVDEIAPATSFRFLGGRRGLEGELVRGAGIPFHATPFPSLRDPDSRLSLVTRALLLPVALVDALFQIARHRPRVCCTTGGLVSLPIVLAARLLRVPVYIWEGNVVPGRVNRLLAGRAQRVGATFADGLAALPARRTVVSGTPIRASLLGWTRERGRERLGIAPDDTVVFVTGGSQGSEKINTAVSAVLPRLLKRAVVLHHTGTSHFARAEAGRGLLSETVRDRYRPYAYLREDMGAALASADLVVARASSSSIMEPLAFGVPLVLIPFAASADAHQEANARAIAQQGAAITIRESELDADRLCAVVLGLLDDRSRHERMRTAAKVAGRPDAAIAIARDVLALGRCV
ncbi:MAG: UDP-N-acetylglucosamine--N-acetylmuramyl-(pentapeptide) pyrophosphoryl-undecaprenol N-acetylglucosamine transferase [Chloroflexi bacterium]|nr:UDP-N-acetylglucosamine--N-acetylmuramyl-(pentapeptide) pyrophosphoryl-undecaprenol N-acetylglucosamine transferase [Chloroflexota bacterium]